VWLMSSGNLTCICLVGHVCQRCGPVSHKTVGTMVDVFQVMIDHTIICKVQTSRLTTLVWNESRCTCRYTEILTFLTMKVELLSPLLSDSPFLSSKSLFFLLDFRLFRTQNRDIRFDMSCPPPCDHQNPKRQLSLLKILLLESGQNKNRDPPTTLFSK
jgi:hypothetical protein